MQKTAQGFTLIELLVVIAIMAVVTVFTLANFRSFGEDQNLKSAILDVASLLREAQADASTNTKCGNRFGATWQVEFTDTQTLNLKCSLDTSSQKAVQLNRNSSGIRISNMSLVCPGWRLDGITRFAITFDALSAQTKLSYPQPDGTWTSTTGCTTRITLTTLVHNSSVYKSLTIEPGGRLYEE